jgi:hypothetical protein
MKIIHPAIPFDMSLNANNRCSWPYITEFWQNETIGVFDGWLETVFGTALVQSTSNRGFPVCELLTDIINDVALIEHAKVWPLRQHLSTYFVNIQGFKKIVWDAMMFFDIEYDDIVAAETYWGIRGKLVSNAKVVFGVNGQKLCLRLHDGVNIYNQDIDFLSYYRNIWLNYRLEMYLPLGNTQQGYVEAWINNELKCTSICNSSLTESINQIMAPVFKLHSNVIETHHIHIGPFRFYYCDEFDLKKEEAS